MDQNVFSIVEKHLRTMKRRQHWRRFVAIVACFVLIFTISALTLPAISQSDDTCCGFEEHSHDDSCYKTYFVCSVISEQETIESSTGPPSAENTSETVEEITAAVEVSSVAEITTEIVVEQETVSEIQREETTSNEEVSDAEEATSDTVQTHEHTEECYKKVLACDTEEHIHSLACTADVTADIETKEDWDELFSLYQYTDIWSVDLISIAEMQIGYQESTENFIVDNDGITVKGYTRYGEWYGTPYSDWANAFVLFSMEYAGIDIIPKDTNAEYWIEILKDESNGLYREVNGYIPWAGDLIFLDSDEDGKTDLAGIVSGTSSDETIVTVVEGDVNGEVAYTSYEITDPKITGYAQFSPEELQGGFDANVFSLVNVSGTKLYHSPDYLEYQYSAHRVNTFMTLTYVLVPYDDYINGWEPNVLNWSAASNANYVVTYCADRNTDVSENGEQYVAQTIYESDYSQYADVLAGIVQHSYPFITESEMQAELAAAYERGETSADLSCCKASDFIAAVQWAIWDMTGLSGTQTSATGYTFPSYNQYALNPLSDPGHTDSTTIQSHIKAIRDWLVEQRAPLPLDIESSDSVLSKNPDGTYNIEVTVTTTRPLEVNETVSIVLSSGDKEVSKYYSNDGVSTLVLTLENLTEQEVLKARVDMHVSFDRLQVYVYDSGNYQDMISGQWGTDEYDLGFDVDVETTTVDVTKVWSDNTVGSDSIEVQLYADGKSYGEPVILSDDNNWSYEWDNLLKYSSDSVEIEYTISESLVPGYYSEIQRYEGGTRKIVTAESVAAFSEGKTYVLTYGSGNAIADASAIGSTGLMWATSDISSPENLPEYAKWTATSVTALSSSGASAYLQNKSTGRYLSYDGSSLITLSTSRSAKAYFQWNHLYFLKSYTNQYIAGISGGYGTTTTNWDSAAGINLYELTETEVQTADISFVITNTETEDNTSVSVEKVWTGRNDGKYPDSVTVMLLLNNEPYGTSVVLHAENNWKYKWEGLPRTVEGLTCTYSIQELPVEEYYTSIQESENEDGSFSFTVTNNWNPEYASLKLQKADFEDPTLLLTGAVFEIYRVVLEGGAENSVTIPYTAETYGILEQTVLIPDSGQTVVEELLVGATYYLTETGAPNGYNRIEEPLIFSVSKDSSGNAVLSFSSGEDWISTGTDSDGTVLQIRNIKGYVLPETGGSGTVLFYLSGILLIILAAIYFITKTVQNNNKRKRRKKS